MATKPQRAQAILDALADGTVGAPVVGRTLDAFVRVYAPEVDPLTLTVAQKAAVFLQATRRFVRETVQSAETAAAIETARQAITPPDLGND